MTFQKLSKMKYVKAEIFRMLTSSLIVFSFSVLQLAAQWCQIIETVPSCVGDNTGSIEYAFSAIAFPGFTSSLGTRLYRVSNSGGLLPIEELTRPMQGSINGLSEGEYMIRVINNVSLTCYDDVFFSIPSIIGSEISIIEEEPDQYCNGASLRLMQNGFLLTNSTDLSYRIEWYRGHELLQVSGPELISASRLKAGQYSAKIFVESSLCAGGEAFHKEILGTVDCCLREPGLSYSVQQPNSCEDLGYVSMSRSSLTSNMGILNPTLIDQYTAPLEYGINSFQGLTSGRYLLTLTSDDPYIEALCSLPHEEIVIGTTDMYFDLISEKQSCSDLSNGQVLLEVQSSAQITSAVDDSGRLYALSLIRQSDGIYYYEIENSSLPVGRHCLSLTTPGGVCESYYCIIVDPFDPVENENPIVEQPCFELGLGSIRFEADMSLGYDITWSDGVSGFVRDDLDLGEYCYTLTSACRVVVNDCILIEPGFPGNFFSVVRECVVDPASFDGIIPIETVRLSSTSSLVELSLNGIGFNSFVKLKNGPNRIFARLVGGDCVEEFIYSANVPSLELFVEEGCNSGDNSITVLVQHDEAVSPVIVHGGEPLIVITDQGISRSTITQLEDGYVDISIEYNSCVLQVVPYVSSNNSQTVEFSEYSDGKCYYDVSCDGIVDGTQAYFSDPIIDPLSTVAPTRWLGNKCSAEVRCTGGNQVVGSIEVGLQRLPKGMWQALYKAAEAQGLVLRKYLDFPIRFINTESKCNTIVYCPLSMEPVRMWEKISIADRDYFTISNADGCMEYSCPGIPREISTICNGVLYPPGYLTPAPSEPTSGYTCDIRRITVEQLLRWESDLSLLGAYPNSQLETLSGDIQLFLAGYQDENYTEGWPAQFTCAEIDFCVEDMSVAYHDDYTYNNCEYYASQSDRDADISTPILTPDPITGQLTLACIDDVSSTTGACSDKVVHCPRRCTSCSSHNFSGLGQTTPVREVQSTCYPGDEFYTPRGGLEGRMMLPTVPELGNTYDYVSTIKDLTNQECLSGSLVKSPFASGVVLSARQDTVGMGLHRDLLSLFVRSADESSGGIQLNDDSEVEVFFIKEEESIVSRVIEGVRTNVLAECVNDRFATFLLEYDHASNEGEHSSGSVACVVIDMETQLLVERELSVNGDIQGVRLVEEDLFIISKQEGENIFYRMIAEELFDGDYNSVVVPDVWQNSGSGSACFSGDFVLLISELENEMQQISGFSLIEEESDLEFNIQLPSCDSVLPVSESSVFSFLTLDQCENNDVLERSYTYYTGTSEGFVSESLPMFKNLELVELVGFCSETNEFRTAVRTTTEGLDKATRYSVGEEFGFDASVTTQSFLLDVPRLSQENESIEPRSYSGSNNDLTASQASERYLVMPNPASSILRISADPLGLDSSLGRDEMVQVNIYTTTGYSVINKSLRISGLDYYIDISDLSSGVYMVQFVDAFGSITKTIAIE